MPSFEVNASEPAVCSTDLILRDVRPYARFSHHLAEVLFVIRVVGERASTD